MPSATSTTETHAVSVFRRLNRYSGVGLQNHCLRIETFARLLLERRGHPVNLPLLRAITFIHDLGLLAPEVEGVNYLQRSRALFHRELPARAFGLSRHDELVVDECLLYNHRVLPVPGLSDEAVAFRQAVWIEHSFGLRRYGLDHDEVRDVFLRYPRDDFDRVLFDFTRIVLFREPWTIVNGIFF
jgi:hypothetical protein